MKIIVDKNIRKITITISGNTGNDEKEYHLGQSADIVLIDIEDIIKQEEENEH